MTGQCEKSRDADKRPTGRPAAPASPVSPSESLRVPSPASGHIHEATAAALVERMGRCDRDAAAEFMRRYEGRIRRRVRTRMSPAIRRLYDSLDIVSTMSRRLDAYVAAGKFESMGVEETWSLLCRLAEHAVVDKARVVRRAERVEAPDGDLARLVLARIASADARDPQSAEIEIHALIEQLEDPAERQIATLWLNAMDHKQIAQETGMTHDAVRKRWQRIKDRWSKQLRDDA